MLRMIYTLSSVQYVLCNNLYFICLKKLLFEWSIAMKNTSSNVLYIHSRATIMNKHTHTLMQTHSNIQEKQRNNKIKKKKRYSMIYSEIYHLYYLFILICGYGNEFGFLEHVCTERGVGQFQNVVGSYQMKTWLIFVHRIQYGLKIYEKKESV